MDFGNLFRQSEKKNNEIVAKMLQHIYTLCVVTGVTPEKYYETFTNFEKLQEFDQILQKIVHEKAVQDQEAKLRSMQTLETGVAKDPESQGTSEPKSL